MIQKQEFESIRGSKGIAIQLIKHFWNKEKACHQNGTMQLTDPCKHPSGSIVPFRKGNMYFIPSLSYASFQLHQHG